MQEDIQRPSVKEYGQWPVETQATSTWAFSIRWQDEQRMNTWLQEGFDRKNLIILGPPQAVEPGIRILTPIVEMANTMETMRKNDIGIPDAGICCPIYINAVVNRVSVEENIAMAKSYMALAERYFSVFHPHLPQPRLITDSQSGAQLLGELASQAKDRLSPSSLDILLRMAEKHNNGDTQELLIESTTAYLLAHFSVYGYVSLRKYYDNEKPTLMLVPQSEEKFHSLMDLEMNNIASILPEIKPPSSDASGSMVIGYSHILRTPHYYPHRGERSLTDSRVLWPTRNQLCRQIGLNGRARDEIWEAIQYIEADISKNSSRLDAISKLQKEVIEIW
jgi:hypothetical protein